MVQHCDPPYRAIGYSYTYRIYVFQCIAGCRAIPPFWGSIAQLCSRGGGGVGGGVSQLKRALCAIGRYRGVSQLYCRKSRLDGPLRTRFSRHCPRISRDFVYAFFHHKEWPPQHINACHPPRPGTIPQICLCLCLCLLFLSLSAAGCT